MIELCAHSDLGFNVTKWEISAFCAFSMRKGQVTGVYLDIYKPFLARPAKSGVDSLRIFIGIYCLRVALIFDQRVSMELIFY